jgi:toxin YoeB
VVGPLKPAFSREARRQIARLAKRNPELLDRIVEVVSHLIHEPTRGLHKPEPLVGQLSGWWSVRLNQRDRLIYRVSDGKLLIDSVEGHYGDK